jgi:hypothetical protein
MNATSELVVPRSIPTMRSLDIDVRYTAAI